MRFLFFSIEVSCRFILLTYPIHIHIDIPPNLPTNISLKHFDEIHVNSHVRCWHPDGWLLIIPYVYTWIFHPCRFLDPGLRAWNFSTKNPFQHLTQILDPGNFGWFVILTLGGGFMYIPQIENNPVPIAPALRCHMDQTTSRGGRISVPQIINIYNI